MADGSRPKTARGSRPRSRRVEVWLTADEKGVVVGRANAGGLSLSAYLRAAGLNHPIRATVNTEAVARLAKVTADIGRLGGLLKLWLAERRDYGAPAVRVSQVLDDINRLQQQLLRLTMEMRRS